MVSTEMSYSEACKLQNGARALDRIRQHYADNSLTDSELVTLIGHRLTEVYGPTFRDQERDVPSTPESGGESALPASQESGAVVTALYTESRGTVVSKGQLRSAERMTNGEILLSGRTTRAATKAEAATYQASSHAV
jgi:hypothetical protein